LARTGPCGALAFEILGGAFGLGLACAALLQRRLEVRSLGDRFGRPARRPQFGGDPLRGAGARLGQLQARRLGCLQDAVGLGQSGAAVAVVCRRGVVGGPADGARRPCLEAGAQRAGEGSPEQREVDRRGGVFGGAQGPFGLPQARVGREGEGRLGRLGPRLTQARRQRLQALDLGVGHGRRGLGLLLPTLEVAELGLRLGRRLARLRRRRPDGCESGHVGGERRESFRPRMRRVAFGPADLVGGPLRLGLGHGRLRRLVGRDRLGRQRSAAGGLAFGVAPCAHGWFGVAGRAVGPQPVPVGRDGPGLGGEPLELGDGARERREALGPRAAVAARRDRRVQPAVGSGRRGRGGVEAVACGVDQLREGGGIRRVAGGAELGQLIERRLHRLPQVGGVELEPALHLGEALGGEQVGQGPGAGLVVLDDPSELALRQDDGLAELPRVAPQEFGDRLRHL
jgi:hypothetical protein